MNQSSSKNKWNKYSVKITGLITVLAAIVTIIAFIFPFPDKNIEKIQKLLEEQSGLTLLSKIPVFPDSILNTNPILKEANALQYEIINYFQVCGMLNLSSEKHLTNETKKIVCIQNIKILIELGVITQNINQYIKNLILLEPSIVNYIDVSGLDKLNETNEQLNKVLSDVIEKIEGLSNDGKKIKIIWKLFNSKEVSIALESKKDMYTFLFKVCEYVINKQGFLNSEHKP